MSEPLNLYASEIKQKAGLLKAGTPVLLSGTVYTARDAAHKRIFEMLDANEKLPFDIEGAAIYYAGPSPTPPGRVCGSFGPTTSSRMDSFAPRLFELGLSCSIGKGDVGSEVRASLVRNGAVYFCAGGGLGALIAESIVSMEVIAFPELGCESVKRLTVEKMPLIVGCDIYGNSVFDI